MIRAAARARSGITLTEILISILILGVGVVSLATLFPLGLLRLRNAQRLTRGAFLVESAQADLGSRNLLSQISYLGNPTISPCYVTSPSGQYNPFVQDTPGYGVDWGPSGSPAGAFRPVGPGLPVAYDPLWRAVVNWNGGLGLYLPPLTAAALKPPEARFGNGQGFLRDDPNPLKGPSAPSAHGLQRLTNLGPLLTSVVLDTFVSPEDVVLQDPKGVYNFNKVFGLYSENSAGPPLQSPSPVVPAFSFTGSAFAASPPTLVNDWRYTWFFTCQQSDVSNGTVFDGDIVVCENRAFGIDPVSSPIGKSGTYSQVTGETVVEAVWGYSTSGTGSPSFAGRSASRSVLLRWPSTVPDPDVKVGNWIADVTYERNQAVVGTGRFSFSTAVQFPPQRCYWYQIAKRTEPGPAPAYTGDPVTYRQMVVWTTTPLRAFTPLSFSGAATEPYHVEAALIMPSVVNVYPRTVYTR